MTSRLSRPRRTVARNATSPRALIAGVSTFANVPDGMSGAGPPASTIALTRLGEATKIPSTALAPAIAAENASSPASLSAGTGCRPNPEKTPPPGTGSPSAATLLMRAPEATKNPSLARPRTTVAKKATWPLLLIGATIGSDSTLNRSKAPPPGTVCPVAAMRRTAEGSAPRDSETNSTAARATARHARSMS